MILPQLKPISDAALKRKTILLLSDDLGAPSGIGTMSKEIVFKTADRFNWIQIASTINHPDQGKILDISEAVNNEMGYTNSSVKLYPYSGYGDKGILRHILTNEKVDAILHFTDPRYWNWLYALEYEIRSEFKIPIMYYSIWDDLPYPHWNLKSYSSCDLLMAINKQTHLIHQRVLQQGGYNVIDLEKESMKLNDWKKPSNTTLCSYIPHGIDQSKYRPLTETDPDYNEYQEFVNTFFRKHNSTYVIFWNNRNIRRKQPGDVLLAFKIFCDSLPKEEAAKVVLFLHTHPRDENGTDLIAVKDAICPNYQVVFSVEKVNNKVLNFYYNIADVTLNIASNEGFGLSSAESLMAGTPVINNITGGLQDQMGFRLDNGELYFPTDELPSNHMGTLKKHGKWGYPVYPSNRSLQGSLETPYIFDDRAQPEDVAMGMHYWYNTTREKRKAAGLAGREFALSEGKFGVANMTDKMAEHMQYCIDTFQPKPRVELIKIEKASRITNPGISKAS